jgi:signal peptidase I
MARRLFDFSSLPRRERSYVLAAMLFWSILAYLGISRFVLQGTEVVGNSMFPLLHAGERYVIHRWLYWRAPPRRGDIVAVRLPGEEGLMVKRVIGLPGEHISVRWGRVFINRRCLPEPYLPRGVRTHPGRLSNATFEIGPSHYFVLGDNRTVSLDSRLFGAVPRSAILGRIALRPAKRRPDRPPPAPPYRPSGSDIAGRAAMMSE